MCNVSLGVETVFKRKLCIPCVWCFHAIAHLNATSMDAFNILITIKVATASKLAQFSTLTRLPKPWIQWIFISSTLCCASYFSNFPMGFFFAVSHHFYSVFFLLFWWYIIGNAENRENSQLQRFCWFCILSWNPVALMNVNWATLVRNEQFTFGFDLRHVWINHPIWTTARFNGGWFIWTIWCAISAVLMISELFW